MAWAAWAVALLSIPAFYAALVWAVEYDNDHDYDTQGLTLVVALGFFLYFISSLPFVFVATAAATGTLRRKGTLFVAGSLAWFVAVPILVAWLVVQVVRLFNATGTAGVRAVLNPLALGSVLTAVVVYGALLSDVLAPVGLPWLVVMVWSPIALIRHARGERRRRGAELVQ